MLTLDDLLSTRNPHFGIVTQHLRKHWLLEENFKDLTGYQWEGRAVSPAEIFNLITHLVVHGHDKIRLVPEEWREDLFHLLALKAEADTQPGFDQPVRALAQHLAGPKSIGLLKSWLRERVNEGFVLPSVAMALWRLEGVTALPLISEALGRKVVYSHLRNQILEVLDQHRERLGISKAAWDLLLVPESALAPDRLKKTRREQAKELRDLMERNIRFRAADLRLLIDHPAQGENLRGLVLAVYSSDGVMGRTFVLPDPLDLGSGETVAIAHPALLSAEDIATWKASFAAEGLVATFDQWGGAGHGAQLQLDGLSAEPCTLFMTLEAKGWKRGRPDSGGVIRHHSKVFTDLNLRAEIGYTGVPTTYGSVWTTQTIECCHFFREPSGIVLKDAEVNPIATSAIAADLAVLREKAS